MNGEGNDSRTHWQRPDAPLGTLIFREGLLSAEQLEDSLGEAVKTGKRLGQVLVDKGLLQESQVARIVAKQKGLGFVNLAELQIDPETARLLPHETAWLHHALPIAVEDDLLVVAVEDPTDEEALAAVKSALGREARFVVATRSEILRTLDDLSSQKAPLPVPPGLLEGPTLNGNGVAEESAGDPEPDVRPAPATITLSPLRIAEPEPEPEPEHAAASEPEPVPEPEPAPEPAPAPAPAPEPAPAAVQPTAEPEPAPAPAPAAVQPVLEPEPAAVEAPAPAPVADQPPVSEPEPVAVEAPEALPEPVRVVESPSPPETAPDEPIASPEPVQVAPVIVPEPPATVPEPVQPAAVEPEPVQPAAVEPEPVQPAAAEPVPAEMPEPPGEPAVALVQPDPVPAPAMQATDAPAPDQIPELRPPAPPEPALPAVEEHAGPAQPVVSGPPPAPGGEGHEVVVRLTDGEVVSAGRFPSADVAKDAAKILTRQITSSPAGEWPEIGGRFVRPDLIVSVDVV